MIVNQLIAANADPATQGPPANHNIPKLWDTAGLSELEGDDRYRLLTYKSILTWSGRYPTPKAAKSWENERYEFASIDEPTNSLAIRKALSMN